VRESRHGDNSSINFNSEFLQVKTMDTVRTTLLIILASLILPFTVLSADGDMPQVVGGIVEKSDSGNFIQVGNFAISTIEAVMIRDSDDSEKEGGPGDLYVGALVEVVLAGRNEQRFWNASSVTILLGDAKADALAQLGSEQGDALKKTLDNISGDGQDVTAPEEETTTAPQPHQGDMHLENGVWVN
jgi:hypothetical protein